MIAAKIIDYRLLVTNFKASHDIISHNNHLIKIWSRDYDVMSHDYIFFKYFITNAKLLLFIDTIPSPELSRV